MLKMLAEIGKKHFVVLAEQPTKKAARDDLIEQIGSKKIEPQQLDLIMGRSVYYGLHSVSPRKPFYFTILREPFERYVSQYGYFVELVSNPKRIGHEMAKQRIVENGKMISLKEFAKRQQASEMLTRTLAAASSERETENSWWDVPYHQAFDDAISLLDKMDFIGFVDSLEKDSAQIFEKLKISPQSKRVNTSNSSKIDVDDETTELIMANIQFDLKIYQHAKNRAKNIENQSRT